MKKVTVVFLFLIFVHTAFTQEQTLMSGKIENGGFIGPVIKVTNINGQNAVMSGGRAGWIINHSFVLGVGGYDLVTNVKAKEADSTHHRYLRMEYGGLDLEYVTASNDLLHLSMELLFAGGEVDYKYGHDNGSGMNSFFVLEPCIHMNLNVSRNFRIAVGVGYRYISCVKSVVSTNVDLSGLSAILSLNFGNF